MFLKKNHDHYDYISQCKNHMLVIRKKSWLSLFLKNILWLFFKKTLIFSWYDFKLFFQWKHISNSVVVKRSVHHLPTHSFYSVVIQLYANPGGGGGGEGGYQDVYSPLLVIYCCQKQPSNLLEGTLSMEFCKKSRIQPFRSLFCWTGKQSLV